MTERQARKGDWISLHSGAPWWPFDPRPEEVTVEDIAHHLAHTCRYAGATKWAYSVGHHAVLICRWLQLAGRSPMEQFVGLHHDDPEGISGFGDVVRPVKNHVPIISKIEGNIWLKAIVPKFGLPATLPPIVKEVDIRICADEKEQALNPHVLPWKSNPEPLGITIFQWTPEEAKANYLMEHYRLAEELAA